MSPHRDDPGNQEQPVGRPTGSGASDTSTAGAAPRRVDFRNPPVIETLLSAQFVPLRGLTLPFIGLFWGEVRGDYPSQEVHPPLAPEIEEFPAPPSRPRIELTSEPDARCWFIDSTSTQLIQIQRDRFIRNWRKAAAPNDAYPRYEQLRPRFMRDWQRFLGFLEREDLGRPEVNQCEVTYINHVELGTGWRSFGELVSVLRIAAPFDQRDFLPEPEMLIVNARFVMPRKQGRLHVAAQPAIRRHDQKEILQLTLTARGKPASSGLDDILGWFDMGHNWIVQGFADITSGKMQAIWGRE